MSTADQEWRDEIEGAVEFLSLIDADDRLLYVNHAQPGIDDYVGTPVYDFISPEYHDIVRASIAATRATGYPQHYDSEAAGADGGTALYSNWIFPVPDPDAPGVIGFVATDITHLRAVEDELARADITLRSIVENAPDHIMIIDRDRRLVFVNRFEHGFSLEDVAGRQVETFVDEPDRDLVATTLDEVIATGERRAYETTVSTPLGRFVHLTRAAPIVVDGEVDSVVMVSTDITELRSAEQERERFNTELRRVQKLQALGQLTGGVAHDFNNLLTAIGGNLDLVRSRLDDGDIAASYLAEATRSVDQAADLVRRLLVFARNQPLVTRAENIAELIDEMAPLLRRTLGETIAVTTAGVADPWLCEVDRGQLEQALLNLAVNARDAMPAGGRLDIVTANLTVGDPQHGDQLPAGDWVTVTVTDTGIGMSPDVVEQACEPFFTTKDPGRGTGLGLSMVFGFVTQSGGDLQLTSEPDRGTSVRLAFPRSDKAAPTPARPVDTEVRRGAGELVLVVEDQPSVRELCVQILESLGYATVETVDAAAAVEAIGSRRDIAAVLSDIGLPGEMTGLELAQWIRSQESPPPVLLMSGYAEFEGGQGQLPDGVRFLPKPFKRTELADAIAESLSVAGHQG